MSTPTPIAVLPLDEVQRIARDAYDAGRTAWELPAKAWNAKVGIFFTRRRWLSGWRVGNWCMTASADA